MSLTKIVATVGPAVEKKTALCSLIKSGASIFRLNLKHNTHFWHSNCIQEIRTASKEIGQPVAILLDLPGPGLKTLKNLSPAAKKEIDFLALSFVHRKREIELLKNQAKKLSLSARILAKIETNQALKNFEEILNSSDGIMIARGDLGENIPFEQVPYYQKKIIKRCVEKAKPVITATQMLKSMVDNPSPTRAEVSDVANAILDYTDAVMLSEETAIGKYPSKAVSVMAKVARFWEEKRPAVKGFNFEVTHQTAAVCYSAYQLWMSPFYQKENIKAFVVLTKGGMTAHIVSCLRPNLPILALTEDRKLRDRLCLLYGVTPLLFKKRKGNLYKKRNPVDIEKILAQVKKSGNVKKGERVIVLHAEDWGILGRTNIVRIQEIP